MGSKDDGNSPAGCGKGLGPGVVGFVPPFGSHLLPAPYLPAGSAGASAPPFSPPPAATGAVRPSGFEGTRKSRGGPTPPEVRVPVGRRRLATSITLRPVSGKTTIPRMHSDPGTAKDTTQRTPPPVMAGGTCSFPAPLGSRVAPGRGAFLWWGAARGLGSLRGGCQAVGLAGLGACAARGGSELPGAGTPRSVSLSTRSGLRVRVARRSRSISRPRTCPPPARRPGTARRSRARAQRGGGREGGPPGGPGRRGDDAQVPKVAVQTEGERPRPACPDRPLPRAAAPALTVALTLRRVPFQSSEDGGSRRGAPAGPGCTDPHFPPRPERRPSLSSPVLLGPRGPARSPKPTPTSPGSGTTSLSSSRHWGDSPTPSACPPSPLPWAWNVPPSRPPHPRAGPSPPPPGSGGNPTSLSPGRCVRSGSPSAVRALNRTWASGVPVLSPCPVCGPSAPRSGAPPSPRGQGRGQGGAPRASAAAPVALRALRPRVPESATAGAGRDGGAPGPGAGSWASEAGAAAGRPGVQVLVEGLRLGRGHRAPKGRLGHPRSQRRPRTLGPHRALQALHLAGSGSGALLPHRGASLCAGAFPEAVSSRRARAGG